MKTALQNTSAKSKFLSLIYEKVGIMDTAKSTTRRAFICTAMFATCFMLLTACANQHEIAYQDAENSIVCLPPIDSIECSVAPIASHNVRDPLPEFTQQLLPIHERKEVIEQEIEDSRNKH